MDVQGDLQASVRDQTTSPRRWLALVCISAAQLMVALDATVINVALPTAQRSLHVSDPQRQWVVTSYTLAFGGLLLLGGRLADTVGRRKTFFAGMVGFAAASALGGSAPNLAWLLASRAAQGAFAAILAPTALSLLAITFTEIRERARAFAIFGAIAGTGGALGLLLGGVLTEYAQWRWCLFINVPIAVVTLAGAVRVLPVVPRQAAGRPDISGAVLVTGGMVCLVYALSSAASNGWVAVPTVASIVGCGVLLAGFAVVEGRTASPLLPSPILADRNRAGATAAIGLAVVAMYGLFLLLTYDFQAVLDYSPVKAGLAFLPMSAATMASSTTISRVLLPRAAPRALIVPGLLIGAAGMAILSSLHAHTPYVSRALPAELLLGFGMGAVFVPAFSTATAGVPPRQAGVASAVANTAQQMGASVGTALLNTIAATATATYIARHHARSAAALVHGYATAAGWAAIVLLAAAFCVAMLVDAPPPTGKEDR